MSSATQPAPPAQPPIPRRGLRGKWIVLTIFAVVSAAIMWVEGPSEIAKWYEAKAYEAYLDGDLDEALASLDEAIARDPETTEFYLRRANWLMERGDYDQALQDCDQAIEKSSDYAKVSPYMLRSQVNQMHGRHDDALADWAEIDKLTEGVRPELRFPTLNGYAYARALAGKELDEALDQSDRSLEDFKRTEMLELTTILVTHSNWSNAVDDLDATAEYLEVRYQELLEPLKEQVYDVVSDELPPSAGSKTKIQSAKERIAKYTNRMELIRLQREIVHAAANEDQPGDSSRRERFFELRDQLVALGSSELLSFAAASDTRGYIKYRMGDYIAARKDIDASVVASEAVYRFRLTHPAAKSQGLIDSRQIDLLHRQLKHNLAVMYYHRALVLEASGDPRAERDYKRVVQLGFEPGPDLF